MLGEQEIIQDSLCDDCPIKDGCTFGKYGIIITTCGKRAKHEAPEKEE